MLKSLLIRAVALAIAVAQYAFYIRWDISGQHSRLLFLLTGSVVLIWFPEQLGGLRGWPLWGRKVVNEDTPGCILSTLGWMGLLVFVPTVFWLYVQVAR